MRSGRGHRVPNSAFAVRPPASGNADDAGNRPSAPATPTIATTRPARSGRGRRATVTTGPNTGSGIQPTATAIVTPPGSGSVSAVARGCLQRWTRRGAKRQCLQALTGSCRRAPRRLQRWTRGRWKSRFFQRLPRHPGRFAKRGPVSHPGTPSLAWPPCRRPGSILTCTALRFAAHRSSNSFSIS